MPIILPESKSKPNYFPLLDLVLQVHCKGALVLARSSLNDNTGRGASMERRANSTTRRQACRGKWMAAEGDELPSTFDSFRSRDVNKAKV